MNDLYPNVFKHLTRNPVTIILLDGRTQTMVYDKTTKLRTLFEESCSLCNLDSDNLFGFATLMDDYYAFLNLDTKVYKINFKEIGKKAQNNILFQSKLTYHSPVHKPVEENRRLSHDNKRIRENNKFLQSTSSTKSAPVYHIPDQLVSDSNDTPVIYFRIKSYVFPHCLRDKTSKSLYFLQLLRNVLDYKLKCADEIYLQLGSFAIQAFYGDYNLILTSSSEDRNSVTSSSTEFSADISYSPTLARLSRISTSTFNFTPEDVKAGRYFDPKKFFPAWIIDKYTPEYLFKEIPQLHKSLRGMSRVESEFSYIRMASAQYSNFNMHLFPVRDQKISGSYLNFPASPTFGRNNNRNTAKTDKSSLWLGLSPSGLEMHQMKQANYLEHLSTLKWSDIDEVTHKSSRISVHVGSRTLKLHTNTKMQADHLFWLTRHMHMYQTKARLNATCTAEALDMAERQKYREKYVYMDLEDLKLNGMPSPDTTEPIVMPSVVRLPFVNTPAALPRRAPSKARPLKMKDLVRMANSGNDSSNASPASSFQMEKHPQYIKKSQHINHGNNFGTVSSQKVVRSPDTLPEFAGNSPYYPRSFIDYKDLERTESDQNTSKIYEALDDSDITTSINESDSRSPIMFVSKQPGRFVSLSKDLTQDDRSPSRSSNSPEPCSVSILPPPDQFRESVCHIGKSTSFDICDILPKPSGTHQPQRHQSDPLISYAQLSRSIPLMLGLCQEFNNTQIISDIRSNRLDDHQEDDRKPSVGMKSWRSDVLYNLNTCLNDDLTQNDSYVTSTYGDKFNSLPRQSSGSYHDLISLSSSPDSDNDHDSVEISSISSFEMNEIKYSRLSIPRSAQVTII